MQKGNADSLTRLHVVLIAAGAVAVGSPLRASLFQHFDASVPGAVIDGPGGAIWLDVSGNGRHAIDDSAGSGSIGFSSDSSVFPTGLSSVRFDGSNAANYGRLTLLDAPDSDSVLDQSSNGAEGFSIFVVARSDASSPISTWNDLIGNTTDVADGAFLMRYNEGGGRFQGAVGGLTVQNNFAGQANYGQGEAAVYAFNYDPSQPTGEITLASSLNDYSQVFDLGNGVTDRDFSNNDPLTLGKAFDTSSRLFVGNVGEVKIYDAALTASALQGELRALESKWTAPRDGRLDLVVDRETGAVTLHSPGAIDVAIAGLSLTSESGSLDPSDWLSIAATHDADSASPTVDADDVWIPFSAEPDDLSEGTLGTSVLAPGQTIDLGAAFVLGGAMDVAATYADPLTETTRDVLVRYVNSPPSSLAPGDYNADGVVNAADYTLWRDNQGQDVALANETVSLGRATAEDYVVWTAGFGADPQATATSTPEPRSAALVALVLVVGVSMAGRFRRAATLGWTVSAATLLLAVAPAACHATDVTVGAYYYPWWDTHDWDETLRARMLPDDHRPVAGYAPSSDPDVIAEHINQSHRGNVSLWASSWWGPGSIEDIVLQTSILTHPRADELQYAVHYESTGRFGSFNSPDYSTLGSDLLYLAENVFSDPNYYRIDDRPVVFMYVTRAYFNDPNAQQALAAARQAVLAQHGYDPYVVGDEVFDSSFNASRASHFDAVTTFDVYAMSGMNDGVVTASDINRAASKYAQAEAAGATLIPGVTPGYNDRAVRDGNNATGRYFSGETIADAGSVFTDLIEQAALPHLSTEADNLVLVNSFNEWHEDTQIEATILAPPSSLDDSPSGDAFTQGVTYEGYGTKYLDLLRAGTTPGAPILLDGDADFDGDLDQDDVVAFAAWWGSEYLVDGVRTGGFESRSTQPDFNYDGIVDFADWFVMRRAHPATSNATMIALLTVPEPSSALMMLALFGTAVERRRLRPLV